MTRINDDEILPRVESLAFALYQASKEVDRAERKDQAEGHITKIWSDFAEDYAQGIRQQLSICIQQAIASGIDPISVCQFVQSGDMLAREHAGDY